MNPILVGDLANSFIEMPIFIEMFFYKKISKPKLYIHLCRVLKIYQIKAF